MGIRDVPLHIVFGSVSAFGQVRCDRELINDFGSASALGTDTDLVLCQT